MHFKILVVFAFTLHIIYIYIYIHTHQFESHLTMCWINKKVLKTFSEIFRFFLQKLRQFNKI